MRKRLLAALLSAVLLLTLVPAAFAASDLDGHWAKKYIDYLADEDIINPSATTGKYQPDAKVTRAEFMRYINRAFHFTETASISYTDVPKSAWYYETVCIAQKYGYINGVGGGRMDPTGTGTREQAATIIGRLYKADPGNVSPSSLDFKDKAKISSWSAGYIRAAVDKGFLAGYSDGTFLPNASITRGQMAKILYNLLPRNLAFESRKGLYGRRPARGYDERYHFGELYAVRCDDRGRSVHHGGPRYGRGNAEQRDGRRNHHHFGRHGNNDKYDERPHHRVLGDGAPAADHCDRRVALFGGRGPHGGGAVRKGADRRL